MGKSGKWEDLEGEELEAVLAAMDDFMREEKFDATVDQIISQHSELLTKLAGITNSPSLEIEENQEDRSS